MGNYRKTYRIMWQHVRTYKNIKGYENKMLYRNIEEHIGRHAKLYEDIRSM